jgi:hypothetical protein
LLSRRGDITILPNKSVHPKVCSNHIFITMDDAEYHGVVVQRPASYLGGTGLIFGLETEYLH